MIVVLLNVYLVILFLLVHFRIVSFNLFWKCSPFIVLLLLLVGLFIPMGWGAPTGPAVVVRNSVSIVPDVAGEVIDVPVVANTPLRAGDVLFKIDPAPFQAAVDQYSAQLIRVTLDDASLARSLPAGSVGAAAIFTDHVKAAHVIRRVLLRQIAIMNYVNPF